MNSGRSSLGSPGGFLADIWRNRTIIRRLILQEIKTRYRGSLLGTLWYVVTPFLLLATYSFVFSVIFKVRWTDAPQSNGEFALTLFSGMIVFNIVAECLNRSSVTIVNNAVFVKKVVFPIETLPVAVIGGALFNAATSLIAFFIFYLIVAGIPPLTTLWFIFIIIPVTLLCLGISWVLSSLGVYLRDLGHAASIISAALSLLSPLFYSINAIPENYRWLVYMNPLSSLLEETRNVLCYGGTPDIETLALQTAIAWIFAWLGYVWFLKTKRGFADVL